MADYNDTPYDFCDDPDFLAAVQLIRGMNAEEQESERRADLLFAGRENPPADELEIIFNWDMTFEDKLAKLQVLRGESVKPKSFDKRLTDSDYLHARALGINLEDEMERARR